MRTFLALLYLVSLALTIGAALALVWTGDAFWFRVLATSAICTLTAAYLVTFTARRHW